MHDTHAHAAPQVSYFHSLFPSYKLSHFFSKLLNVAWGKRSSHSPSLSQISTRFTHQQWMTSWMYRTKTFYILRFFFFFQLMFVRSLERITKMYFKSRKKRQTLEKESEEKTKQSTENSKQFCFSCTPISNDLFLETFFSFFVQCFLAFQLWIYIYCRAEREVEIFFAFLDILLSERWKFFFFPTFLKKRKPWKKIQFSLTMIR